MTITTRSQLDALRDLSATKNQYEEKLGWRVFVDVGHRRLVLRTDVTMDAVVLPVRLADRALAELRFAMLEGPVAASPGGQWLTFLTLPAASPYPNLPLELRQARVQLLPRDGQVILPRSLTPHGDIRFWRWVEAPRPHRPLPPWCAVIAAARRAVRW